MCGLTYSPDDLNRTYKILIILNNIKFYDEKEMKNFFFNEQVLENFLNMLNEIFEKLKSEYNEEEFSYKPNEIRNEEEISLLKRMVLQNKRQKEKQKLYLKIIDQIINFVNNMLIDYYSDTCEILTDNRMNLILEVFISIDPDINRVANASINSEVALKEVGRGIIILFNTLLTRNYDDRFNYVFKRHTVIVTHLMIFFDEKTEIKFRKYLLQVYDLLFKIGEYFVDKGDFLENVFSKEILVSELNTKRFIDYVTIMQDSPDQSLVKRVNKMVYLYFEVDDE